MTEPTAANRILEAAKRAEQARAVGFRAPQTSAELEAYVVVLSDTLRRLLPELAAEHRRELRRALGLRR